LVDSVAVSEDMMGGRIRDIASSIGTWKELE
jgi:hypothetical protein